MAVRRGGTPHIQKGTMHRPHRRDWRGQEPTERQLKFLRQLCEEQQIEYEEPYTRGGASLLITRLLEGATPDTN